MWLYYIKWRLYKIMEYLSSVVYKNHIENFLLIQSNQFLIVDIDNNSTNCWYIPINKYLSSVSLPDNVYYILNTTFLSFDSIWNGYNNRSGHCLCDDWNVWWPIRHGSWCLSHHHYTGIYWIYSLYANNK